MSKKNSSNANNRNGSITREEKAHAPDKRPERIKFGAGSKFTVPPQYKKEGYFQYWFIDRPGEIEQAKAAWYEFVLDEKGNKITVPDKSDRLHYLMEIDQATHDKDIAEQQADVTQTTKNAIEIKEGEYSPTGKNTAATMEL